MFVGFLKSVIFQRTWCNFRLQTESPIFCLDECPELCSRHGDFQNGVCKCHKGWKGRECEIPEHECEVLDCNGNGRCIDGKCVCHRGFRGPHCGLGKSELPLT